MLNKINSDLPAFICPLLLFCVTFFSGCSTSGIYTVDGDEFTSEYKYIKKIYSVSYNDSVKFAEADYEFIVYKNKLGEPEELNCYPKFLNNKDSLYYSYFKVIPLDDKMHAKIYYQSKPTIMGYIGGVIGLVAVIAFLWWANGERNKRK